MSFTFLHAADLHLGSPFKGMSVRDEEAAQRFASASREAFSDLIERAIAEKVAFAVIAGDIFDGEWKDMAIGHFFNRKLSKLTRAGIKIFIVKGNHDAESEVTKALPLPEGTFVFPSEMAETIRIEQLQVALHGRSFPTRAVTDNFARTYPPAVPGWFNIGILHTSLAGNPMHETYAPCTLEDLTAPGYDYWALGHVHEFSVVSRNPFVVFPGNLQGRNINETGAKGAAFVDVVDGHVVDVRRVLVDKARFAKVVVDISGLESEADVDTMIRDRFRKIAANADGRMMAVRVRITGTAPVHRLIAARTGQKKADVEALLDHVFEDAWLEKLEIVSRESVVPIGARAASANVSLIDTTALLQGLERDPEVRSEAKRLVSEIGDKWPSTTEFKVYDLVGELDQLMDEALNLVLARAIGVPSQPQSEL